MFVIKNARIIKIGNSKGITIPSQYLSNGLIDDSKEYTITLEETVSSHC